MSIILARLRERDPRKGWLCRDYTSSRGNTYRAGVNGMPSPLTVVKNQDEIKELSEFSSQFEFIEVQGEAELSEMVQSEMEDRARKGEAPIRAQVNGATVTEPEAPKRSPSKVLSHIPVITPPEKPEAPEPEPDADDDPTGPEDLPQPKKRRGR